ncbi:MAG: hypothetical protein EXX96DRAFT_543205 [Benjaminiella poitrasii]|nr:MAG: hypothetical protein EXX96DRAFT_543205 [Benjaminiella poitrasii]
MYFSAKISLSVRCFLHHFAVYAQNIKIAVIVWNSISHSLVLDSLYTSLYVFKIIRFRALNLSHILFVFLEQFPRIIRLLKPINLNEILLIVFTEIELALLFLLSAFFRNSPCVLQSFSDLNKVVTKKNFYLKLTP